MFCPLHGPESKRSASLNVLTGDFYCFASCGGMNVVDLLRMRNQWVDPAGTPNGNGNGHRPSLRRSAPEVITEGKISGWQGALMSSDEPLDELITRRGLTEETLERFRIGWDPDRKVYTIPVFGPDKEIWNVRRYTFNPKGDTKIWSVSGMRPCELYPLSIFEDNPEEICILGGEWDTLLTIQNGYAAITRTASETTWNNAWNSYFDGKRVYLGHDADHTGQNANRKVFRALRNHAAEIKVLEWPFPVVPKHGKDATDFWLEHDRNDFEQLKLNARVPGQKEERELKTVTVLDSFDSQKVGDPVRLMVTIKGKKEPGYSVPKKVHMSCSMDRGPQCNFCPMKPKGGDDRLGVEPTNPVILGMLDAPISTIIKQLVGTYGVPGGACPKLSIEVEEHQAVEQLFARPSIDHGLEQKDGPNAAAYKNITITSAGRHDTLPNNTIVATGALFPNPRTQRNEFLAWEIERQETSMDRFEVTPEAVKLMRRFQTRKGQRPLKKLAEINKELARHVTGIKGRPEMHALMDLTFHSVTGWRFGGKTESRGWIQSIIIGDTRTGKSEAAAALVRHFGAGEIVGGEAASLAGLVGGLQQINGKDWAVTWGVIPLNNGRIVIIDEFPHPDDISKMSDTLSSGVAKITKVQQDATEARTRTLWMGNPPQTNMSSYTHGVDAFRSIISTPEDIARFDLAMALRSDDVPSEIINTPSEGGELRYTAESCHVMMMWCWTRKPNQVIWAKGAEDAVNKLATAMGKRYTEDPPLVQAANIRVKIARVAVALAARMFSTDDSCENVVVTSAHVEDAVAFMDRLYNMPSFGYAERSTERLEEIEEARANMQEIKEYLHNRRDLIRFLRQGSGIFKRQDMEEILRMDGELSKETVNTLWKARMIRREGSLIRIEPTLHEILREVKR